jgi:hypothetical protein
MSISSFVREMRKYVENTGSVSKDAPTHLATFRELEILV